MAERGQGSVTLRETERREIEKHVQAFLKRGGKIEQVPLPAGQTRPVGKAWYSTHVQGLDSF